MTDPITLPWPPSVNHYWRAWRGRVLISREGRAYRKDVCAILAGGGFRRPPPGGRIALCMDAFPPDRRKRDLDNLQKSVLDSLEHAGVYDDDGQIDLLVTRRRKPVVGGRLNVRVGVFPLSACPVCGAAVNPENN
jgi:crossover junction endodeoxyribonuclease RusA